MIHGVKNKNSNLIKLEYIMPRKIDSAVHIIKSDEEREEERRAAQEEQSAHDFADGSRLNLRRIGWA